MKKILIVGINGSPRKNGNTVMLLKKTLKNAEKHGGETILIHLIDKNIKPCLGCYSISPENCTYPCKQKDDLQEIHELLIKADGMVLATPSYWYGPTGLMKTFIDRLCFLETNGFLLEGKVVGFLATAEESGGEEAVMSMVEATNGMGMITPPYSTIFYNSKHGSEWAIRDAGLLGKNMVLLIRICKNVKKGPNLKGRLFWGYPEDYKKYKKSND